MQCSPNNSMSSYFLSGQIKTVHGIHSYLRGDADFPKRSLLKSPQVVFINSLLSQALFSPGSTFPFLYGANS